jgi:hypothetical protein
VIARIQQRTATFATGTGGAWQVSFHRPRQALDISVAPNSGPDQRQEGLEAALTLVAMTLVRSEGLLTRSGPPTSAGSPARHPLPPACRATILDE